jgi:hypothetical protein
MGSPFARAFAVNIQTKGMRIDDEFRMLRDAVKSETQGDQLPDIVQDDLPNGAITLVAAPREPPANALPPTRVRSRRLPARRRPPSSSKPRKSGRPFATRTIPTLYQCSLRNMPESSTQSSPNIA